MRENKHENKSVVKMEKMKSFFTGLLVGGAVGAGAALLKAPRSGEETREQIQKKVTEVQSKAGQTVEEVRDRAEETGVRAVQRAEDARSRVQEVSNDVAQRAEKLKEEAGAAVNARKKHLSRAAAEIERAATI